MRLPRLCFFALVMVVGGCAPKAPPISNQASEHPKYPLLNWQVLGPFNLAPREGARNFTGETDESTLSPSASTFYSELVPTGRLKWKSFASRGSKIDYEFDNVDWHALQSEHGRPGVFGMSYLYTELALDEARTLQISLKGVPEFYINGQLWFGEAYQFSDQRIPIPFKAGLNRILLKVPNFGPKLSFQFQIDEPTSAVSVLSSITAPDVIECPADYWLSLPLTNNTSSWLRNISARTASNLWRLESWPLDIAPHSVGVAKLKLHCKEWPDGDKFSIPISIESSGKKLLMSYEISLQRKDRTKDHIVTFVSELDNSVQYYAIKPPSLPQDGEKSSLIIGLHGASVEARSAMRSYSHKPRAFTVLPTNRRPHGFAWQGIGRLDALEVLANVQDNFNIDKDRIHLTGHSMGGQGAWHIATHHPDRFASIVPAAAWTSLSRYLSDHLNVASTYASPQIESYFRRVTASKDHMRFLTNARSLPVLMLHALGDEVVSAFHSRLYQRMFDLAGGQSSILELESKEHWCHQVSAFESEGYACVNPPQADEFFERHTRPSSPPRDLKLKIWDLSAERNFWWLTLLSQERVFSETEVNATWNDSNHLIIETTNLKAFEVRLHSGWALNKIVWNDNEIEFEVVEEEGRRLVRVGKIDSKRIGDMAGGPEQVFYRPAIIVYGDSTDLHTARLLNHLYWRAANASLPIYSSREVSAELLQEYNLILIADHQDPLMKRLLNSTPFRVEQEAITWEGGSVSGSLGFVTGYPSPWSERQRVLALTTTNSRMKDKLLFFRPFSNRSGLGLPDFMAFDSNVTHKLMGGVRLAGFYSNDWGLDNHDYTVVD